DHAKADGERRIAEHDHGAEQEHDDRRNFGGKTFAVLARPRRDEITGDDHGADDQKRGSKDRGSASKMKVRRPAIWPAPSSSSLRFSRSMPTSAPRRMAVAKSSATVSSSRYSISRCALAGVLRIECGKAVVGGWSDPALGDEAGDQARRCHV